MKQGEELGFLEKLACSFVKYLLQRRRDKCVCVSRDPVTEPKSLFQHSVFPNVVEIDFDDFFEAEADADLGKHFVEFSKSSDDARGSVAEVNEFDIFGAGTSAEVAIDEISE